MRIVADENLDGPLVAWLRDRGHDVVWMAEADPGRPDREVLAMAAKDDRVLITWDLDYGVLVFRRGGKVPGMVLLRFRASSPRELLRLFTDRWHEIEQQAPGHYLVVTNAKLRSRPLPS
jgi:predicted nuclease of predicted toxin-antitoxin system